MRVSAYILTGDPTWIEASVLSYYSVVDDIVVSFDRNGRGWTGCPLPPDEAIDRLKAIDSDRKMRFVSGDYARLGRSPMENDTHQRQCAMELASAAHDWVLAIDNDEIVTDARRFVERLAHEVPVGDRVVGWPLRVFFQMDDAGRLLEIVTEDGRSAPESVPIAYRPGVVLSAARRTTGPVWQYRIGSPRLLGRTRLRQLLGLPLKKPPLLKPGEAILHLSWLRSKENLRRKVASWGHAEDFDGMAYIRDVWEPAKVNWCGLRDFHPFIPGAWGRLEPTNMPAIISQYSARDVKSLT